MVASTKSKVSLLISIIMLAVALQANAQNDFETGTDLNPCQALENTTLFKPLGDIGTVLMHDESVLPPDCSGDFFSQRQSGDQRRFQTETPFQWKPTNFSHRPAYFDDVPLERYGQTKTPHFQPFISGAKFVLQVPALPYKMGIDRPFSCVTTLGHRPPGDCVPCIRQKLPHQGNAALIEAATAVGLVLLLP